MTDFTYTLQAVILKNNLVLKESRGARALLALSNHPLTIEYVKLTRKTFSN